MPAFSLIETVLVLAIGFVLLALGVPILSRVADEGQAHLMASRLTSQFMMARRVAQLTHQTCYFEFDSDGHYTIRTEGSADALADESFRAEKWRLEPLVGLPHPTQSRILDEGLSSTHGQQIRFGAQGSSSATLVFSRNEEQAVCIVVASQSGSFRVYLWDTRQQMWLDYF